MKRGLLIVALLVASLLVVARSIRHGALESQPQELAVPTGDAEHSLDTKLDAPSVLGRDRVALDAMPAAVVARPRDSTGGSLTLVAIDRKRGAPVEHVRFVLEIASDDCGLLIGMPVASEETDATGRAEFSDLGGWDLKFEVLSIDPGATQFEGSIGTIAAGLHREIRVELDPPATLDFWARIVLDESGAPVPFARAQLVFALPPSEILISESWTADADGLLEVRTNSARGGVLVFNVGDLAQECAPIVKGHETAASAIELRLQRSGGLGVTVENLAGVPLPGLRVLASPVENESELPASLLEYLRRGRSNSCPTNQSGRAGLAGLPARFDYELRAYDGERQLPTEMQRYGIEPGKFREVRFAVDFERSLAGLVLDQSGQPVADIPLWLVKIGDGMDTLFSSESQPTAHAQTDGQGRFEIPYVASGDWWIGPAASSSTPSDPLSALAPYGQKIEMPPAPGRNEVVIHVCRGLFISGQVLIASGEPAANCFVRCKATDAEHSGLLWTYTDKQGAFKLGPLSLAEYEVSAGHELSGGFAPSSSLRVNGGAEAVKLIVESSATLRVSFVDAASGETCRAGVRLTYPTVGPGNGPIAMSTFRWETEFTLASVPPGAWGVIATASESRMASARITLIAGETRELTLRLGPSAELKVVNHVAADPIFALVSADGILCDDFSIDGGRERRVHVPPGRIAVKFSNAQDELLHEDEVTIAAGELRELGYP